MGGVGSVLAGFAAGLILGIGGYAAVSESAASDPALVTTVLQQGNLPLIIENERGGVIAHHVLRLREWRKSERPLRFAGRCSSACTLYLALPYEQTCIAAGASFAFHAPSAKTSEGHRMAEDYMLAIYPQWVRAWIEERGGLSKDFITMEFDYARRHMRVCDPEDTPARGNSGARGFGEIGL